MSSRGSPPRYKIIDLLAKGGMAEVYRAEAHGLGGFTKLVAIKRILPQLGNDPKFVEMFLDEARLGARLTHSNCVSVLDVGQGTEPTTGEPRYFLVMEYVDGASLRALMSFASERKEPLPAWLSVYAIQEICKGLSYAHELRDDEDVPLGIVHRDVSPANVLITRYGEVKLADFGLAKAATHVAASESDVIKGKFPYLAPESIRQLPVDGRADLFAVGAILWEMLAGEQLFKGATVAETIALVEHARYRSLVDLNPGVDDVLDSIVKKSLARERENRFSSARELVRALNQWLARREHAVSSLDLAERVQALQARKAQRSGLVTIATTLHDVGVQFANMKSMMELTPDWSSELPSFRMASNSQPGLAATLELLSQSRVPPDLEQERTRLLRLQLALAAAGGALLVLVTMVVTFLVSH